MKTKDLMIGDLVRNSVLNEVFKMNTTSMRNICWDEDYGAARYNIEPIPLTEEILKANGFKLMRQVVYHYHSYEICKCVYNEIIQLVVFWNTIDNIVEIPIGGLRIKLRYVHEFQHAIRLCYLNELADDFVV